MIKTTYTCDRCKKDQPERKDVYEIKLTAEGGSYAYSTGRFNSIAAFQSGAHWCRACLIETGFFTWTTAEAKPPETPPTLEEMIRQIIATAIEEHSP